MTSFAARARLRPFLPALAAGSFWIVLLAVLGTGAAGQRRELISGLLLVTLGLTAAGGMLAAARALAAAGRVPASRAWRLLGLGLGLHSLSQAVCCLSTSFELAPPVLTISNLLALAGDALLIGGLLGIPARRLTRTEHLTRVVEMLIIAVTALLVYSNYVLLPDANGLLSFSLAQHAPPVHLLADLLVLCVTVIVTQRAKRQAGSQSLWLFLAGITTLAVSNAIHRWLAVNGLMTAEGAQWVSGGWGLAFLFYTLAATCTMVTVRRQPRTQPLSINQRSANQNSVTLLMILSLVAVFATGSHWIDHGGAVSRGQLLAMTGIVFALAWARHVLSLVENDQLTAALAESNARLTEQSTALADTNQEMQMEITERKRAEERLAYDALHDALTGLPNRALLLDRLKQAALRKSRTPHYNYAVLFLDLDRFKLINDSLGHFAGDEVLVRMGQVLTSCVHGTDTVARLGGDEFVVLLEHISGYEDVTRVADRLLREVEQPLELSGQSVSISTSIGVVVDVEAYRSAEEVLRDADSAMYQAKANGKARYETFNLTARAEVVDRLALENDLRGALAGDQLELYFQPILRLPQQTPAGFEALLRWHHPQRGMVSPAEFIPIAEETGLILPIGDWVLARACEVAALMQERFPHDPTMHISVNISARQLKQPDFVRQVHAAMQKARLPGGGLTIEVTESALIEDVLNASRTLQALHDLGIHSEIDDFGTGYSSLNYLHHLPVHKIKIDRSFINTITEAGSPDMVRAIVAMARELGIDTVAEGIETDAQLAELGRLRCGYVQGFRLGHPMPYEAIETWLEKQVERAR